MASDYNKSVTSRNSVNPANFSFNTGNIIGYPNKISSGSRSSSGGTTTNLTLNLDELLTDNLEEGVTSEKIADPKQYNTDDKKGFFESLGDMLTSVGATLAVGTTSVLSGVLDIVEGIGDGVVWVASKAVGIVSPDAEEAMKEFIARDLVSEANEWLYEDTEFGRAINDASYMKYDSELAQGIRDVTEDVAVFAAATALTVFTGGAAAPLTIGLGAAYGLGEASESTYATYGTDTSTFQELLILGNGALSALSWYTSGKLGKGFIELGKSMAEAGVKEILAEMCKGIFSKDMLKELLKPGNLVGNAIASLMQAGGDIGLIATKLYNGGEVTPEEWALLVGELILYFGLNTAEDVLSDTIISYGNPKIDVDMNKTPDVDDTKPIEILDETGLDTNPTKASDTNANPTENSPELTWEEYFKQKYGDGVEHTSGTGVDGHNGSFVDPNAELHNRNIELEKAKEISGWIDITEPKALKWNFDSNTGNWSVDVDWPKFGGIKPDTVSEFVPTGDDIILLDRFGSQGGGTYALVPEVGNPYTLPERSIFNNLESPNPNVSGYRKIEFNQGKYVTFCDGADDIVNYCQNNGLDFNTASIDPVVEDKVRKLTEQLGLEPTEENIAKVDSAIFGERGSYTSDLKLKDDTYYTGGELNADAWRDDIVGIEAGLGKPSKYGYTGIAAQWETPSGEVIASGGAFQFNLRTSESTLNSLGIMNSSQNMSFGN